MEKNLDSLVRENLFLHKNQFLIKQLSKREKEIFKLISHGISSKEISDILCISIHTVNNHRKNIIRKIGKKNLKSLIKLGAAFEQDYL